MVVAWWFKAFAHSLTNPPITRVETEVNLKLINTFNVLRLKKKAVRRDTEYRIDVLAPAKLGLTLKEVLYVDGVEIMDDALHKATWAQKNLILACNLMLQDAALSAFPLDSNRPHVISVPSRAALLPSIFRSRQIHERARTFTSIQEEIDETRVVETTKRLMDLRQHGALEQIETTRRGNIMSALFEYEAAASSSDRLFIFKHLYNALELIANVDGEDRTGKQLDVQIALITEATLADCEGWRKFYMRTKHISRSPEDLAMISVVWTFGLTASTRKIRIGARNAILGLIS